MYVEDVAPAAHPLQQAVALLQVIVDRDLLRLESGDTVVLSDQTMALMGRLVKSV